MRYFVALLPLFVGVVAQAADHAKNTPEFSLFPAAAHVWKDGPASLPAGAQIMVLEGDPTKEGPFVFRVKAPDGYHSAAHTSEDGTGHNHIRLVQHRHG